MHISTPARPALHGGSDADAPRKRGRMFGYAAASLAGLALTNHLLARRSEARHPPEGKFITVDGVKLHYRAAGVGEPLVLLHGNGVASDDFVVSGLFGLLARTRRVIAFDRPGFGYSERPRDVIWTAQAQADLLIRALDRLDAPKPLIVGHSWGTMVAAEMCLAAPEAVSGLVLMSGYYRPTFRPDALMFSGPAVPVLGDVMRYTISPPAGRLMTPAILKRLFAPAPVSDRFRRCYPVSQSLRPVQLRAAAAEAALMGPDAAKLAPRLRQLSTTTLVLAGDSDQLIDTAYQSRWLAEQLPNAGFVSVAGAGHMVHHTAPEAVADAILAFDPLGDLATTALHGATSGEAQQSPRQ